METASIWRKYMHFALNLGGNTCTLHSTFLVTPSKHSRDDIKIYPDAVKLKREIDHAVSGKLHDKNAEESCVLIKELALYDNEGWNDPRDFAKPVKNVVEPIKILDKEDTTNEEKGDKSNGNTNEDSTRWGKYVDRLLEMP
ncbi:hypothetical protein Tco_0233098, partial [Tanacetum coccineum]